MRPAFSNPRQAAAFALLLLLLLASPLLATKKVMPPREQIYSSTSWFWGSYPYLDEQIFKETNEIDIAFVGSSRGWYDMDTPYLQKELSRHSGRDVTVLNLCWLWAGFDATYFIVKDLLDHRKVKMLVFSDEQSEGVKGNRFDFHRSQCMSYRWFRYCDGADDLAGLSLQNQASLYAGAILGIPRNLLCLVRTNLTRDIDPDHKTFVNLQFHSPDPTRRLGALCSRMSYDEDPEFVPYHPQPISPLPEPVTYSAGTRTNFQFIGPPTQSMELYFFKRFVALARLHGVKLVMIHYPLASETSVLDRIPERECWPEEIDTNLTLIGFPPARLFAGMTPTEQLRLFCNHFHLNQNGQEYFNPLIAPRLISLYEAETSH